MTDKEEKLSKVVVSQACALEDLRETVEIYTEALEEINDLMVCIGRPLNDSTIKYTKEQLAPFIEMHDVLCTALRRGDS